MSVAHPWEGQSVPTISPSLCFAPSFGHSSNTHPHNTHCLVLFVRSFASQSIQEGDCILLRQPSDLETISTKEKLGQLTFHGHAYQNQIKTRKFQSCLFHIAFKDQTRIFLMQMAHDRYFLLSALAMYSLCLEITDVVLVQITKL